MHTLQYLATEVQLELEEQYTDEHIQTMAKNQVSFWLDAEADKNGFVGNWSDWQEVGGRWADTAVEIYNDDNACSFLEKLDLIDQSQLYQFNEYFSEFDFPTINTVMTKYGSGEPADYQQMNEAGINSLSLALKIMRGYWDYNSSFFDIDDCTTKTKHLREKLGIDKTAYRSVYCLVPVDFHF